MKQSLLFFKVKYSQFYLYSLGLLLVSIILSSCNSVPSPKRTCEDGQTGTYPNCQDSETEVEPELEPEIKIVPREVNSTQGHPCLVFTAIPQENLRFITIKITLPNGVSSQVYNLQDRLITRGQRIFLQGSGTCTKKLLGDYIFEFEVRRVNENSVTVKVTFKSS